MSGQSLHEEQKLLQSLKTPYEIYLRWATRDDIPQIARILHINLLSFEFFDHFAPKRVEKSEEFYTFVLNRVRMFFVQPDFRYMVAEKRDLDVLGTTKAEIIGFSGWDAQGENNPLRRAWRAQQAGLFNALEQRVSDVDILYHRYLRNTVLNHDAFDRARRLLHGTYHSMDSLKSNIHLLYLMVDPAWQRGHGIGHRLIQWGLDVADKLGLPVVLESSLVGYSFYLRHGFEVLKMVRIDVDPSKAYDMPVLLYEPEGRKGQFLHD